MGFIDRHESERALLRKFVHVAGKIFWRSEDDIDASPFKTSEDTCALFLRSSSHEHFSRYAEARNHLAQMERLIGNERTQRIEEDALFVLLER